MRALKTSAAGAVRPAGLDALDIGLPRIQAAIAGIFFLSQIAWITRDLHGLSSSESQMGAIGLRTLDGLGLSDRYLESLAGSHLWPVIAAAGYQAGGGVGARLMALLLTSAALLLLYSATRNLFGERAAIWTLAAFAASAPFAITGHQALMEPLAIAALSGGLWASTRLAADDHRKWIAVIAVLMVVATMAQYRAGLALIPISLVIGVLRGRRSRIDLVVLWAIVALGLIVYFDVFTDQLAKLSLRALLFDPYEGAAPFASTQTKVLLIALWGIVPLVAGCLAWWRLQAQRRLIGALLCGPLLWTAALLAFADFDDSLVYPDLSLGLIFVLPVAGLFLASISQTRWNLAGIAAVLGVLALAGAIQTSTYAQSWVDYGPINETLARDAQPGELVMANDPWPVRLALYESGNIERLSDVVEEETLLGGDVIYDFCEFTWIVSESLIQPWSSFVRPSVESCGEIETVYSNREIIRSLDSVMLPQASTGTIEVSRNLQPIESEIVVP
jgi:hypothetical protein